MALARLACVKHAASVRPEPGSNSPSEIVELSEAHAEAGVPETSLSSGLGDLAVTEAHHPVEQARGMGDAGDHSQAPLVLAHPIARMFHRTVVGAEQGGHAARSCPSP